MQARVEVQFDSEPRTYHQLQSWLGALAQCRDVSSIGARKYFQGARFNLRATAGIRVQKPRRICLGERGLQKP